MIKKWIKVGLLLCAVALSGCSLFSPVPASNEKLYVIHPEVCSKFKSTHGHRTLFVAPMQANELYRSSAMAYSTEAYRINYFVKNRWAIPPAHMLQNSIVQALQRTHYFSLVDSSLLLTKYHSILSTELVELRQVFFPGASEVHLIVRAKLINGMTNQFIAAREFSVVERASSNTPLGGVIATNQATERFLRQLTDFCLQHL